MGHGSVGEGLNVISLSCMFLCEAEQGIAVAPNLMTGLSSTTSEQVLAEERTDAQYIACYYAEDDDQHGYDYG